MIDETELTEARYERKFLVTGISLPGLLQVVRMNPALFRTMFEPRWINNIYFDSIDLRAFADTIEGVRDRVKIRIRWYGDATGAVERPVLELKRKRAFVTVKDRFPLPSWETGPRFSADSMRKHLATANLPAEIRELLKSTRPTLFNRYSRSYGISHCGSYRITIDNRLQFQRVFDGARAARAVLTSDLVLEMKYGIEADAGARFITQDFPFRMTKNSKYATGMLLTAP